MNGNVTRSPAASSAAAGHPLWRRALGVWLAIVLAETLHGVLRGLWLVPRVGEAAAQRVGFLLGCAIVLGIAAAASRWLGARSATQRWQVGLLWCVLMAGFEIAIGLARGFDAARIGAEFNPAQGGLMAFGLLLTLAAPTLGARLRERFGKRA